ncbi:transposase [Deinococcus sp. UYEF24]
MPEFKQQAVQLAQQPSNANQGIASDLGISQSALSSWIKAANEYGSLAFPGQGVARLTPEEESIKRLERELVTWRQEMEILKSAAIFLGRTAPVWGLPAGWPRKQNDLPVCARPAAPVSSRGTVLGQNGRP